MLLLVDALDDRVIVEAVASDRELRDALRELLDAPAESVAKRFVDFCETPIDELGAWVLARADSVGRARWLELGTTVRARLSAAGIRFSAHDALYELRTVMWACTQCSHREEQFESEGYREGEASCVACWAPLARC